MSASEKLRALHETMYVVEPLQDPRSAYRSYMGAIPALIAVVEAAEEALRHPHHVEPLPTNEVVELRMPKRVYDKAVDALTALEEKL